MSEQKRAPRELNRTIFLVPESCQCWGFGDWWDNEVPDVCSEFKDDPDWDGPCKTCEHDRDCHTVSKHVPEADCGNMPTGTEARVCADIAERQRKGIAKYGTTVEQNPLTRQQWLQHAYEEALDLAVYLKRLIDDEQNPPPDSVWHE
jgi:hypothetical protein